MLNSSSVTTVLVVGFVTAGVMSLQQSVGVIMGANIGSTVTAQVLAFNIAAYALDPVAISFFMTFTASCERVRQIGMMVMGIGLVFFGMGRMSDARNAARSVRQRAGCARADGTRGAGCGRGGPAGGHA